GVAARAPTPPVPANNPGPPPCAGPRPRSALLVRAAQTRAPRLHGAEGGRDGRLSAAAGAHPPRPSGAREPRAHARKCDRGRGTVRHHDAPGDPPAAWPGTGGGRARAPTRAPVPPPGRPP